MENDYSQYIGMYMSTYSFVGQNKLEDVANEVLGLGWEAEDDVVQIEAILEALYPNMFVVEFIANSKFEDDIRVRIRDEYQVRHELKELVDLFNWRKTSTNDSILMAGDLKKLTELVDKL